MDWIRVAWHGLPWLQPVRRPEQSAVCPQKTGEELEQHQPGCLHEHQQPFHDYGEDVAGEDDEALQQ